MNNRCISSTRLYTGRVINLDMDHVQFPDGNPGELEIVRHPGASAVLPLLHDVSGPDPELLLIRQYRYATGTYLYEIPAGRLNPAETPEACARRELLEETGYDAGQLEPLVAIYTTPGFTDERIHLFIASGLSAGLPSHEADEFIEVQSRRLSEALRMVERGIIQDAKTAITLLYAAAFILKR